MQTTFVVGKQENSKTAKQLTVAFYLTGGEVQVETQGQHFGVGQGTCLVQAGKCILLLNQPKDKDKDDNRDNANKKNKDKNILLFNNTLSASFITFLFFSAITT